MAFTIDQVKVDVRYYLGGIPETTLSDTLLEDIINRTMTRYGLDFNIDDDYCKTVYYSILETLKYLIRENISSSASTGGGEIKSRSEKVGDISVKTEYTDGTDASESGWDTLYDYYLANPTDICEELADLAKSSFATVYFGDVSNKEVDRVNSDQDSRDGWDVQTPYRESVYSCLRKKRNVCSKL